MGGDWSAPVTDEKSVTEPKWNREHDESTQPDRDAVPEGNSPGANVNGYVDNNSLLTSGKTETALQISAVRGRLPETGLRPVVKATG